VSRRAETSGLDRRLQRWLANERIRLQPLLNCWVIWVLRLWGQAPLLALATLWALTEGTKVQHLYPFTRRQQRLSVFRLGLDYLKVRPCSARRVEFPGVTIYYRYATEKMGGVYAN